MTSKLLQAIRRVIFPRKDHVFYSGSILPAPYLRWCGHEFKDNSFYLQSAEKEAQRLLNYFNCNNKSQVVDIGCGQGRLPTGILRVIGELEYIGIDVDRKSVEWCNRHIESRHPSFQFHNLDAANERYNQNGSALTTNFRFDLPDNSVDIIYLFSVFTHMHEKEMRIYLSDFTRILKNGGKVFFTIFAEQDVPNISINPGNYVFEKPSGPLHIVRYEQDYLFSILNESGFIIENFSHRTEADSQSAIYLTRSNNL
jgi:SAM-dependent methyltransferase